ncbi:MAG: hypothetical protein KJ804_07690 [Proteobacteria bacterium]|nr:hypothetical protein [Pseudomonadota bacterium]MBU1058182.1 hypothetical protein [Pseudomonadota bacterium]
MKSEWLIPRFFHEQQQVGLLGIDYFSCVEYRALPGTAAKQNPGDLIPLYGGLEWQENYPW